MHARSWLFRETWSQLDLSGLPLPSVFLRTQSRLIIQIFADHRYTIPLMKIYSLKNYFLVAMPNLADMNFSKSVIFIYEHDAQGAMGLVINKPLTITLG